MVVEHGGDASSVAAPIAGRVLAKAFGFDVEMTSPQLLLANPSFDPDLSEPVGATNKVAEAHDEAP